MIYTKCPDFGITRRQESANAPSSLNFDHNYSYSEKILPRYYVRTSCHRKIRDNSLIMSIEWLCVPFKCRNHCMTYVFTLNRPRPILDASLLPTISISVFPPSTPWPIPRVLSLISLSFLRVVDVIHPNLNASLSCLGHQLVVIFFFIVSLTSSSSATISDDYDDLWSYLADFLSMFFSVSLYPLVLSPSPRPWFPLEHHMSVSIFRSNDVMKYDLISWSSSSRFCHAKIEHIRAIAHNRSHDPMTWHWSVSSSLSFWRTSTVSNPVLSTPFVVKDSLRLSRSNRIVHD